MPFKVQISNRPAWQNRILTAYKAKTEKNQTFYGDDWILLSIELRKQFKHCQWCDQYFKQRELQGHHVGCVKYNVEQKLDRRIILVVCDGCHELLEPWSRINLTQMLPQLFEA